jgi:hypothetical protein
MRAILTILAIMLMAGGIAVGLINIFSPGTVTVGLNFDVAATLFTGGCLLLGLALVAGRLAELAEISEAGQAIGESDSDSPAARRHDLPDFMTPAGAATATAAATANEPAVSQAGVSRQDQSPEQGAGSWRQSGSRELAAENGSQGNTGKDFSSLFAGTPVSEPASADETSGGTGASESSAMEVEESQLGDVPLQEVGDAASELEAAMQQRGDEGAEPAPSGGPAADTMATESQASEMADEAQSADVGEQPAETEADEEAVATAEPALTTPAAEASGEPVEGEAKADETIAAAEEATEGPGEEAPALEEESGEEGAGEEGAGEEEAAEEMLFVVEETTIREKPARMLSDGTVEAETDEGWMRFENVEHVEEYLDAMKESA